MPDSFVLSVRIFNAYRQFIWPIHRLFAKGYIAQRCTTCAASIKMTPLEPNGKCSLCNHRETPIPQLSLEGLDEQRRQFHELLSQTQGAGRRAYDALLLFSGGKDSTYMAHRLKQEYPRLRILAVTLNNGFMSPIAEANTRDLVQKLGIDHCFLRVKKQFYVKLFRFGLTHLNSNGAYGTVDFSDGEFTLDSGRNLAAQMEIPLILCGYSRYQVQDGLELQNFESPRANEAQDRTTVAELRLTDIFDSNEMNLWWRGTSWSKDRVPRLIFPLYVWDLEEDEIKRQVDAWGLLSPRMSNPALTNHRLIPLFAVTDIHQRGFSSFEPEFCRMIREGKADLAHWRSTFEFLEYTARTGMFIKPLIYQLLRELDLNANELGIHFSWRKPR